MRSNGANSANERIIEILCPAFHSANHGYCISPTIYFNIPIANDKIFESLDAALQSEYMKTVHTRFDLLLAIFLLGFMLGTEVPQAHVKLLRFCQHFLPMSSVTKAFHKALVPMISFLQHQFSSMSFFCAHFLPFKKIHDNTSGCTSRCPADQESAERIKNRDPEKRSRVRAKPSPIPHATALYGDNIRKFGLVNKSRQGLIEAVGAELKIITADPTVCHMLGWTTSDGVALSTPANLPTSVHDLLPPELRGLHRRLLRRACAAGRLPDVLRAPLRNGRLIRLDGTSVRVDVCVGVATEHLPLDHPECLFYALVAETGDAAGDATEPLRETRNEEQLGVIEALYGLGATLSVSRGLAPPPDVHEEVRRARVRARRPPAHPPVHCLTRTHTDGRLTALDGTGDGAVCGRRGLHPHLHGALLRRGAGL